MGRNVKQLVINGERLIGLSKIGPNRWRISQTGERFTERDEYTAAQYFKQQTQTERESVFIPIAKGEAAELGEVIDSLDPDTSSPEQLHIQKIDGKDWDEDVGFVHIVGQRVDKKALYAYFRHELINSPDIVAQLCGLPQLATFASLKLPKPPLRIADILECYEKHSASTKSSKWAAVKLFNRMVTFCEAKTLADLTTAKLLNYRQSIESDPALKSGGTKQSYFSRVKTILGFASKMGLDPEQIRDVLDRCKVLWTATAVSQVDPHPISRDDFHALLSAAVGIRAGWRVWLLCGLNLCLHMIDVCNLRWDQLNLDAGTYSTIRNKTKKSRVPQAAVLWPETIAELTKIPKRGEYVFVNRLGKPSESKTRMNMFSDFRAAVGVSKDISWDWLRDGAYTAAVTAPGVDEKFARVMAGHTSSGLQDNYVLRHPMITKTACDAVYKHYLG